MYEKSILLVEPNFPYPNKSKNKGNSIHKNFIPIGLLKIGSYYRKKGHRVDLIRGNKSKNEFQCEYNKIIITTLFTYWSKYVWDCVKHYRIEFPKSIIEIGGIYATLHHDKKYFKEFLAKYNANVRVGLHNEAEKCMPDYSLLEKVDYHVMHGMRGCIRKCPFCGTWKIEPERIFKTPERIEEEIIEAGKNKVVFFDNNFLSNKYIIQILETLADIRINDKPVIYESQSGFDGRLLIKDPKIAVLLKKARFTNIRIAWDNSISDMSDIELQIKHLTNAGYHPRSISVFVIYNYEIPINEMVEKVKYCLKWNVQIADCRYRPLEVLKDNYKPHKWRSGQTSEDYYIHENWTDADVRLFRKIVRIHNITIRYVIRKINNQKKMWGAINSIKDPLKLLFYYENKIGYNKDMERWSAFHNTYKFFGLGKPTSYDKIKSSEILTKHIQLMNKVKNYCKKNDLQFSLKGLTEAEQKYKLLEFIENNSLK